MTDTDQAPAILSTAERQRLARRRFLVFAGAAGGTALLSACGSSNSPSPSPSPTPSPTPTPTSTATTPVDPSADFGILNFLLNLEYLEAQFFSYAVYGTGLSAGMLTGTGTQGTVTGGRAVVFSDMVVAQFAREIAADEAGHVSALRTLMTTSAVAMPNIDIDGGTTGAFTALMRAAGVIGSADTFDPYASDENFLLSAFFLEDLIVTAYKGASIQMTVASNRDLNAGLLGAEGYHAGLIRTTLYRKALTANAGKVSDWRDSVDGATDLDQGVASTDSGVTSNVVPTDGNGIAYSRSAAQTLNVVYLTKTQVSAGGFFPSGVNGDINKSANNA